MRNKILAFLLTVSLSSSLIGQNLIPYSIFNSNGKKVKAKKMLKFLLKSDVVFFGELHNNSIAHWLQLKLLQEIDEQTDVNIGAEMFESDNQEALNAYLSGEINQAQLDSMARLWPNYSTDYKPLVDYAKLNNLPFIATNIPRKYASKVYKEGGFDALNSLDTSEKKWIAPSPIAFDLELSQYKNMLTMMGDHGSVDLVKAQAIKDATMAHFINLNLKENQMFYHINGSYHSDFHQGILWYLKRLNPNLTIKTITTVEQDQLKSMHKDHLNKADFIVVVDSDMTKTY
ncbi:MAG: ChaN family lipoprotein [Flavobacteriaceae bacterium]